MHTGRRIFALYFITFNFKNFLLFLFLKLTKYFHSYRAGAYFGETAFLVCAYMPFGFAYQAYLIINAKKYFTTNMLFIINTGKMFFAFCGFFNYFFVYFQRLCLFIALSFCTRNIRYTCHSHIY